MTHTNYCIALYLYAFTIVLFTLYFLNRVLVMDKGEVAELDSPGKLLQDRTSIFYQMTKDAGLL